MMIWCSYCQQFLKESAPFEELTVSHGLCEACAKKGLSLNETDHKRLMKLVDLQSELYEAGKLGDLSRINLLIQNSIDLGVRPMDMIFGLLNPMLVKMGELWSQGLVSAIEEHRFTHFCEELLQTLKARNPKQTASQPGFLLASADGNYHNFGLKLIHLWLEARGCSVELITPSIPMDDLLDYTIDAKPQLVGISVSLPEQAPAVQSYIKNLSSMNNSPVSQVFIGGYAVKSGLIDASEMAPALLITHLESLIPYLPKKIQRAS